jgi:hypothetical protein
MNVGLVIHKKGLDNEKMELERHIQELEGKIKIFDEKKHQFSKALKLDEKTSIKEEKVMKDLMMQLKTMETKNIELFSKGNKYKEIVKIHD